MEDQIGRDHKLILADQEQAYGYLYTLSMPQRAVIAALAKARGTR